MISKLETMCRRAWRVGLSIACVSPGLANSGLAMASPSVLLAVPDKMQGEVMQNFSIIALSAGPADP